MFRVLTLLSFLFTGVLFGQGIDFKEEMELKEIYSISSDEGKLIFVDAYTTWCGPCKKLSKYVFTDDEVGAYFNANFVNVKLDMEKSPGLAFQKSFPVSSYPTLFFINGSGELVHKVVGYQSAEELLAQAKRALSKGIDIDEYMERYESGDRSFELITSIIKYKKSYKEPYSKYANAFLRSEESKKLTSKEYNEFLISAVSSVDSKIYTEIVKRESEIREQYQDAELQQTFLSAAETTLKTGFEYQAEDLIDQAINAVSLWAPDYEELFSCQAKFEFAIVQENEDEVATNLGCVLGLMDDDKDQAMNQIDKAINLNEDNTFRVKLLKPISQYYNYSEDLMVGLKYAKLLSDTGDVKKAKKVLKNMEKQVDSEESRRKLEILKNTI